MALAGSLPVLVTVGLGSMGAKAVAASFLIGIVCSPMQGTSVRQTSQPTSRKRQLVALVLSVLTILGLAFTRWWLGTSVSVPAVVAGLLIALSEAPYIIATGRPLEMDVCYRTVLELACGCSKNSGTVTVTQSPAPAVTPAAGCVSSAASNLLYTVSAALGVLLASDNISTLPPNASAVAPLAASSVGAAVLAVVQLGWHYAYSSRELPLASKVIALGTAALSGVLFANLFVKYL